MRETITINDENFYSISKSHNRKNVIYPIGPTNSKFEQQASRDICILLNEAIDDKTWKLRNITDPKILILYSSYFFGNRSMYFDSIPFLQNISNFQCIYIVDSFDENFLLSSKSNLLAV